MKFVSIVIAVLLVIVGVNVGPARLDASAESSSAPSPREEVVVLFIEKMTCALCPITVKAAIGHVAGVNSVAIDFPAKTVTVRFDPAATTTSAIAAASGGAGYPARIVRR